MESRNGNMATPSLPPPNLFKYQQATALNTRVLRKNTL
ncbi:hypothetical protein PRUB_b0549 [Pseudoalteromonas rubra]|uniref:Uncharacterized protein n=1 Tax=Pseudoalteromonas rubra TaxID=43658 RepID=A0A8T0C068_9GAMM|nr:hypothetical protein PRUB_b0549 [Pseudoalteromonas rubra]